MPSLFYPQLSSGALVQYPLRKTRHIRTVVNTLADGTAITASDAYGGRLRWDLTYLDVSAADCDLIQTHFENCYGPWLPFVFIDPTGNMLSDSGNFVTSHWQLGANINLQGSVADPFGSTEAMLVTNEGQVSEQVSQTLTVPASYQYCFSVYAQSAAASQVDLIRGADLQQSETLSIGPEWTRIVSSGRLGSALTYLTAAISLAPGQQVSLFAPQLEPQSAPSRYRPTIGTGGVYPNAHWAINNLAISSASPSRFNISCAIETNL